MLADALAKRCRIPFQKKMLLFYNYKYTNTCRIIEMERNIAAFHFHAAVSSMIYLNTLRPGQNGCYFPDDVVIILYSLTTVQFFYQQIYESIQKPLISERYGSNSKHIIVKLVLRSSSLGTQCEITRRRISQNLTNKLFR